MNQGQIVGPAMLLNVIMRWPRATPVVAMLAYGAAAYAGQAPVPEAVNTFVQVAKPVMQVIASL